MKFTHTVLCAMWLTLSLMIAPINAFKSSCPFYSPPSHPKHISASAVHVTFLHINDLYELDPTLGKGGLSKVCTIKNQILASNKNLYTFIAGDLFSPSALSDIPVNTTIPMINGQPYTGNLNGAHMVQGMNVLELDVAVLGNHESDVKVGDFTNRLLESNFTWLSANALNYNNYKLQKHTILSLKTNQRSPVTIGVFGITISSNNKTYQSYYDENDSINIAIQQVTELKQMNVSMIVALTHWFYPEDIELRNRVSDIDIIMGGHEHDHMNITDQYPPIFKADANVASVWVHDFWIDPSYPPSSRHYIHRSSQLIYITANISNDARCQAVVDYYVNNAYASYNRQGFNLSTVFGALPWELDGLAADIDVRQTTMGDLLVNALESKGNAILSSINVNETIDLAAFNNGGIRIDDIIPAGTVLTHYDALRILPFVDYIWVLNMTGSVLNQFLTSGANKPGAASAGGLYGPTPSQNLQISNYATTTYDSISKTWSINNKTIDFNHYYLVATIDYLAGGPAPYTFLSHNPSVSIIYNARSFDNDLRNNVIKALTSIINRANCPTSPFARVSDIPKYANERDADGLLIASSTGVSRSSVSDAVNVRVYVAFMTFVVLLTAMMIDFVSLY